MKKSIIKKMLLLQLFLPVILFAQIPLNGLIGGWTFTGNSNDMSGNGNHGTPFGPVLTADRFLNPNCAYNFNGSGNYMQMINAGPMGTAARSISFWMRSSSLTHMVGFDYGVSNANGGAWQIGFNYNCQGVQIDVSDQALVRGNNLLADEQWHHIVAIMNPTVGTQLSDLIFYVDAVLQPSITCFVTGTTSIMNTAPANPITIGRDGEPSGIRYFNGDLDDYYFYNRVLSYAEVLQLYNYSPTPTAISKNILSADNISLFPNPGNEFINIEAKQGSAFKYSILNALGSIVLEGNFLSKTSVDVKDLPKGFYMVQLICSDNGETIKKSFIRN